MHQQNFQNFFTSVHRPPEIPFYRGFFGNKKWPYTSVQVTFFIHIFEENFSFLMLNKLISWPDCVYIPSYSVKYVS